MRLPKRSINNFSEFIKIFLARYANFVIHCLRLFKVARRKPGHM
jgi:hypothetical protein